MENVFRYQSKILSTDGYLSREECIKGAKELAAWIGKHTACPVLLSIEREITWDGEDFPSISVYFLIKAVTATPVYRE